MERLRRNEFLRLTGLTNERLDGYARRDQLPWSIADELSGYSWFEAFLQLVIEDLCGKPKLERRAAAKATACAIAPALAAHWHAIVNSAEDATAPEIVWVRLTHKHSEEGPQLSNIVGTTTEVGAAISFLPDYRKIDGGSATACAAIMIRRAGEHAIEIPDDFWTTAPTFIADDAEGMWARAIEASVAKVTK